VLTTLGSAGTLKDSAMIVVERRSNDPPAPVEGLIEVRRVTHGDSALVMMRPAG
jgi:hypothetical protein